MDNIELKKLDINIRDFNIDISPMDINCHDLNMDIPQDCLDFNLNDFTGFLDVDISPINFTLQTLKIPDGDSDGDH